MRFEQLWLPLWPLVSDALRDGIYRTSREKALGKHYAEANPDALSNLLVVEIDHRTRSCAPCGSVRAAGLTLWSKTHAHAIWVLSAPFPRTEYARHKPLAYAAAVVEGVRFIHPVGILLGGSPRTPEISELASS